MEGVRQKIQSSYEDMGPGERKLADCILKEEDNLVGLSISELAQKAGCSEATVVRFSRRLGLSGYQELKISLAQEKSADFSGGLPLEKEDDCFTILEKRMAHIVRSLENTRAALSPSELEKTGRALLGARRVLIFGLGNSSSVAHDAEHKFLRAGLWATAYTDNHMQAIAAAHARKGDLVLGISHSGSSVDIVEALRLAREGGALTVALTNFAPSPIDAVADIKLSTRSDETNYSILAMASRISQLAIIDALYTYLLVKGGHPVEEAVRSTERALQGKKY